MTPIRSLLAAALMLGPAASVAAAQDGACPARGTQPILTVAGAVAKPNRGPFVEAGDRLLAAAERKFDKARRFTADDLAALGMRTVRAVSPYDKQAHAMTGPTLASVLDAAGAGGATLVVQAVDGYAIELTRDAAATLQPILALCQDGAPLGLGDTGPTYLTFETAAPPTEDDFARMVWAVVYVEAR